MRSRERHELHANWVDQQLDRLTPRQKLAQRLIALPGIVDGHLDRATRTAIEAGLGTLHGLVGISVSGAARYHIEVAEHCADLGLPPVLQSANLESGIGYAFGGGGTDFPYPRGIGHADDPELARDLAEQAAREARLAGLHWTFSPCVDVLTNPSDPILGVRAFGLDATRTSVLGAAQVRGYQAGGLLATAKHFPGHGDSATDTHHSLAVLPRTPQQHEHDHLPPFAAAIAADVASIMVAHVALPALGVNEPASLSPLVNRTWLREELGYDGIIVTDALHMGAIAQAWSTADAAIAALAAGADVANVKCPADEIPAILDALEAAQLDRQELDRSVARLLRAKASLGLPGGHGIDLTRCAELDNGTAWQGPGLTNTVSTNDDPKLTGPAVVVGDSELARRLADRARLPLETVAVSKESLATITRAHPEAALVAVTCPLPVDGGIDSAAFASAVRSARAPVVAVVNSAAVASGLRVEGPVISVPAVDAFEMVSDSAIAAVVEVLSARRRNPSNVCQTPREVVMSTSGDGALRVIGEPTRAAMGERAGTHAAQVLRDALRSGGRARVMLAAAPSQAATLATLAAATGIDWSRVDLFHMDEYVGLAPGAPQRFATWLTDTFVRHLPEAAFHPIDPGTDPAGEAARYEALLGADPVALVLLGLGVNGHLAFNDPPADFADPRGVRVVELDGASRRQQVDEGHFATVADVPETAVTVTIPRLLNAATVIGSVPGSEKRVAVAQAIGEPIGPRHPGTALRTHPDATLYIDAEADPR